MRSDAEETTLNDTLIASPDRGRWTCWLYILSSPVAVTLFALSVAGLASVPATVGVLILAAVVPATRAFANVYRREAGRVLGEPVVTPYRDDPDGSWLRRLGARARDPQSWRDILWLLGSFTVGLVLAALCVFFFLSIVWHLILPFLVWVTPEGTFERNSVFLPVDSVAAAFLQYPLALAAALLWWYGSPHLMKLHARLDRALLGPTRATSERMLRERVSELAETRSEAVDVQAAELRRIERDIHDGAQARLVSSGITLGMALEVLDDDPETARAMLQEAHASTVDALQELRSVVRGIHPPVLSDRGLVGAVEAVAVQMPIPVEVSATLAGRPPAPVESALYFAVAECLANVGKHAGARRGTISFAYDDGTGRLHVEVGDDGAGGALLEPGGGLAGIRRRLAVFDGTLELDSPEGGPTTVAMAVPCELSPART